MCNHLFKPSVYRSYNSYIEYQLSAQPHHIVSSFDAFYTMCVQTVLPISHLLHLMYITIATSYIPSSYGPSTPWPSTYEPTKKPVKKRKLHRYMFVHIMRSYSTDLTPRPSYVHHNNSNQETHTHKET